MIISRFALFFAFVFGLVSTQAPEFWQQYKQRLGGAIDELAAIVAQFDTDAAAQHLTQAQAIARLESDPDPLAQGRGVEIEHLIDRLESCATQPPLSTSRTSPQNGPRSPRPSIRRSPSAPTKPMSRPFRRRRTASFPGLIGFVIGGGFGASHRPADPAS